MILDPNYARKRKVATRGHRASKSQKTTGEGNDEVNTITNNSATADGANGNETIRSEEDGSEDEIPSFDDEKWKKELLHPRTAIVLTRKSDEYDSGDPYWQFRLIVEALKRTQPLPADAMEEVVVLSEDPTAQENTAWEPPSVSSSSLQSTSDSEVFNHQNYANAADMDTLISANIDTALYETDLIIPSEEALVKFQAQQKAFDNKDYQRENHDEACEVLQITNPNTPRLRSMNRWTQLKPWQPVAIAAIAEMRTRSYLKKVLWLQIGSESGRHGRPLALFFM